MARTCSGCALLLIASLQLCTYTVQAHAATPVGFYSLSHLNGYAVDVSDNGVVASLGSGFTSFLWTVEDGQISPSIYGDVYAVSADGSTMVGRTSSAYTGFHWSDATGFTELPRIAGSAGIAKALAVSADGSIVVGYDDPSGAPQEGTYWTAESGTVSVGDLSVPSSLTTTSVITNDGSTMYGYSNSGDGYVSMFRYTVDGGIENMGYMAGMERTYPQAVSADGTTVVGTANLYGKRHAFRWTEDMGFDYLGDLGLSKSNLRGSLAYDVNHDGSIIVGSQAGVAATIWDETNGLRFLQDVLADEYGLDMTGWTLEYAYGISADGRYIVGSGIDESVNSRRGWVAVIPEPTIAALFTVFMAGLLRRPNT